MLKLEANRATAKTPVAFTNVGTFELLATYGRDMTLPSTDDPFGPTTTSDAGEGESATRQCVSVERMVRDKCAANGIPGINNPESHNVYWVNMPDLASVVTGCPQIQRGAGTSTNGAGAFGASVTMVTDTHRRMLMRNCQAHTELYNTNRETFRVGSGLAGNHWSLMRGSVISDLTAISSGASSELWSYLGRPPILPYNTTVRLLAFGGKRESSYIWLGIMPRRSRWKSSGDATIRVANIPMTTVSGALLSRPVRQLYPASFPTVASSAFRSYLHPNAGSSLYRRQPGITTSTRPGARLRSMG